MKSYIYIVITKELFRRSIAGINGAAGGDPTPLPPNPGSHRSGTLWDYVPVPAAGGGGRGLLCFVWVGGDPKSRTAARWGCPGRAPIIPLLTHRCQKDPPTPPPGTSLCQTPSGNGITLTRLIEHSDERHKLN